MISRHANILKKFTESALIRKNKLIPEIRKGLYKYIIIMLYDLNVSSIIWNDFNIPEYKNK